jgi:hypothetical protein
MAASGMEVDWHEELFEDYTVEALVLEYTLDEALSFISYNYGMHLNNISLNDDDLQILDGNVNELIEIYGSTEELEDALRNYNGYYNLDIFIDLITIEFGVSALIEALYGEEGSGFPDSRVSEYVERNGFLMAMHILRLKPGF